MDGKLVVFKDGEKEYLRNIKDKLDCLKDFLGCVTIDFNNTHLEEFYWQISQMKNILGNFDNDVSFLACLMAKSFLKKEHPGIDFDISLKPQGAPGLDIDIVIDGNKRIIGEIKTTSPYGKNDFGSNQKTMMLKDFDKLRTHSADYKYFFVTEQKTFEIVNAKYLNKLQGVKVVLLPA